ncbi:MAG: GerMN domain-containing protein [Hungatella sp.]
MKRWIYGILILCMLAGMAGCGKKQEEAGTSYKIYYLNASMTKLIPQEYRTNTTDQERLIEELLEQFMTVPKELDNQAALSDKVALLKYRKEDVVLYLYFDSAYGSRSNMNETREILCRAALAKTMTQIAGIEYINIYVGDQPLLDPAGNAVGMMTGSEFIDSISDVNDYEKTEIVLFFTDETGEKLVEEKRQVVHDINTSLEKLVVEELIKGPETGMGYPTLPKETKLLNVSLNENVCYLNFDASFLNSELKVKEYIPIYAIVNSLASLSTVNKVQIAVNGSQDVLFRDAISLNTLFERNLDLGGIEN